MLEVGQWILYRNIPGFILKADTLDNRYLVQLPRISQEAYWVAAKYIQTDEAVHLHSEDVQDLMAAAVQTGDFQWYKELTERNVPARDE